MRPQLEKAYSPDTGRTAIEPVFLRGVCLLQYVDGIPDRLAVDWLRYHAGWYFALNRQLGDERFHPTTLPRVFDEQFVLEAGEFRPQGKGELDSGRVQNPLAPEATCGVRQQGGEARSHVGY